MSDLENQIRSAVSFHKQSATGFNTLKCPMCKDKKVRAGFKFDSDKIIYNCFRGRCPASTEYVYGEPMYPKFKEIMETIGVQLDVKDIMKSKEKRYKIPKVVLNPDLYEEHHYKTMELYGSFEEYDWDKHWWFTNFLNDRHANFKKKLLVGTKEPHKNQLIVPFHYSGKLIGWQGVQVNSNKSTFYQTSSENTDLLYINTPDGYVPEIPIIVEGIMDAVVLPNGVATLGNTVSRKQAYILRNSSPILLPDRKDSRFFEIAKRYGWRISIPMWKEKDVNEVVQRYGKFVAAKMIFDGVEDSMVKAETRYRMWRMKRNAKTKR